MNKTETVLDTIVEIKGMFERIHREYYIPTIYDNDPGKFKRYINALNHVIKEMERLELKGINIEQNLGSGNDIEIKNQTIPKYKVKHLINVLRPSDELMKRDCFSQFVGSVCDLFEEKLLKG